MTDTSLSTAMTSSAVDSNINSNLGSSFAAKSFSVVDFLKRIRLSSVLLALILAAPLLTLIYQALITDGESFEHIKQTVLPDYIINTLILIFGVGLSVVLIGVPTAWLIASCQFVGRDFFKWALVLPLAMPAYIVAYVYTDLLDYAGPVQIGLRQYFGWQSPADYWFFDIRSMGGAIAMLALVLFPYVYLLARAGFAEQNAALTHASRALGASPTKSFFKISLPLARNSIIAGVALVMMESMADFATVSYFAVSTLTTAVYDTWLGHYDLASAAKLSSIMVLGIFVLLYMERLHNGKKRSGADAKMSHHSLKYQLKGLKGFAAFIFCGLILTLAFIVPVVILADYALDYFAESWQTGVVEYALNSVIIAGSTALTALLIAIILNHKARIFPFVSQKASLKVASSGYAIPGTVMAIGVLFPLTFFDQQINAYAEQLGWNTPGLLLSGSIITIIVAHVVRFVAIANKGLEASYANVSPSLDMVSKTMGRSGVSLFANVHFPLIRKSAVVAALLIFVESMKELPAALLLRPFDFQTLPTYLYQFASDEQLEIAALGAVLIVVVGLLPLLALNRSMDSK